MTDQLPGKRIVDACHERGYHGTDRSPIHLNTKVVTVNGSFFQRLALPAGMVLVLVLLAVCTGCGSGPTVFGRPLLIISDPEETRLFMYDNSPRRLVITDPQFKLIREITHPSLQNVWGMTLSTKGEIVVATDRYDGEGFEAQSDQKNAVAAILWFDQAGNLLKNKEWRGGLGPVKKPIQIEALPDSTFLLTDAGSDRIFRLNQDGEVIGAYGQTGSAPGQVYFPNDIQRTPDGKILLTDTFNSRVQEFRLTDIATVSAPASGSLPEALAFERVVLEKGMEPGKVRFPQYMSFDTDGNWYISELETMRVGKYDSKGTFLKAFIPAQDKTATGTEQFFEFYGVTYLPKSHRLLVADSLNAGIHVFSDDGATLEVVSGPRP